MNRADLVWLGSVHSYGSPAAVTGALPAVGDRPSRRETLIAAAPDMAEKLVTTQYDFLRSVVRSADRSLSMPGATKK